MPGEALQGRCLSAVRTILHMHSTKACRWHDASCVFRRLQILTPVQYDGMTARCTRFTCVVVVPVLGCPGYGVGLHLHTQMHISLLVSQDHRHWVMECSPSQKVFQCCLRPPAMQKHSNVPPGSTGPPCGPTCSLNPTIHISSGISPESNPKNLQLSPWESRMTRLY